MCRLAAYLGPGLPLSGLISDPPHSLSRQAYAPREQLHGNVNVDGTGAVWWPADRGKAMRYASESTPWADPNLAHLAPRLTGRMVVAAVRGATPGMPGGRGAVAPFLIDGLAIAHNGWVGGFRDGVGADLLRALPAERIARLEVVTDSTVLAALVAEAVATGADLRSAMADTLAVVRAIVQTHGQTATLNLVVADGDQLVASRASVAGLCNSLYVLQDAGAPWDGGTLVASEPLDDQPWRAVPPDHLLTVTPQRCRAHPLTPEMTT